MKKINNCSICNKKFLKIIDLGLHPCADTFLDSKFKANLLPRFPLQIGFCNCFHFTAITRVSAQERYQKFKYSYTADNSPVSRKHFKTIAKKLSKSSSDYNHNDKFINTIITDITAYAENKWEKEIDIIMVGHYHQQKIITKNEKSLVFLGDWLSKFSVTTIIDGKIWQGNWEQFIKLS